MLLMDTDGVRVEFGTLDSRLYVYKDGRYVGNELLIDCIGRMLDEDAACEYTNGETAASNLIN
jgi:hypothetical protein